MVKGKVLLEAQCWLYQFGLCNNKVLLGSSHSVTILHTFMDKVSFLYIIHCSQQIVMEIVLCVFLQHHKYLYPPCIYVTLAFLEV